jgi:hypothetical protein
VRLATARRRCAVQRIPAQRFLVVGFRFGGGVAILFEMEPVEKQFFG